MNTDNGNLKAITLGEGTITIRPLPAEDFLQAESLNAEDQSKALLHYMPLITAAVVEVMPRSGVKIPADEKPLDYVLSGEDYTSLWRIVRTLYELSGGQLPAEYVSKCEGSSLG